MGGDSVTVVIPFRDRGIDPRRAANLKRVVGQWQAYNFAPMIVSDGRKAAPSSTDRPRATPPPVTWTPRC